MSNMLLAFQANDSSHELYVTASDNGVDWQTPASFIAGIQIGGSPAAVPFNGKYVMAFGANDDSHALYVTSSIDGQTWQSPATGYGGIKMGGAPAIAVFRDKLFIAFQANDSSHILYVTSSSDGVTWQTPATGYSGIKIGGTPAMATFKGKLYIAFQANDSSHELYVTSSSDGVTWQSPAKYISGIQIGGTPAMAAYNNKLYIAFQANDSGHELYVTSSSDGVTWQSPASFIAGIQIGGPPTLTAFDQKLFVAFQANDTSHALYVSSTADGVTWQSPATGYGGIRVGSAPAFGGTLGNYPFSGCMLIYQLTSTHPTPPTGCVAIALQGPDTTAVSAYYPLLTCNGNTYWAYSYADDRDGMYIVGYNFSGSVIGQWEKTGARSLWKITSDMSAQTVTFWGKSNQTITMTWTELGLYCYQFDADDLQYLADYYSISMTTDEINSLVAALPQFNCGNCCSPNPYYNYQSTPIWPATTSSAIVSSAVTSSSDVANAALAVSSGATTGSTIGAIAGGILGGLIGGPAGAAIGAVLGGLAGANIGSVASLTPISDTYVSTASLESSTYASFQITCGPFNNGNYVEDLLAAKAPMYGYSPIIGSLAGPAAGNTVAAWYPTSPTQLQSPVIQDNSSIASGQTVYKYIFVIVPIKSAGTNEFQLRFSPETFFKDAVNGNARLAHSQLTQGYAFFTMLGSLSAAIYASGTLYITNNQIIGIDTTSGHYYAGYLGKDQLVLQNTTNMLTALGYNVSSIMTGETLEKYLYGNI